MKNRRNPMCKSDAMLALQCNVPKLDGASVQCVLDERTRSSCRGACCPMDAVYRRSRITALHEGLCEYTLHCRVANMVILKLAVCSATGTRSTAVLGFRRQSQKTPVEHSLDAAGLRCETTPMRSRTHTSITYLPSGRRLESSVVSHANRTFMSWI